MMLKLIILINLFMMHFKHFTVIYAQSEINGLIQRSQEILFYIFNTIQNRISSYLKFPEEQRKITPLNQKTKDRLVVIGLLALEAFFIFGATSNFYRYIFLNIYIDLYLAIISTIGMIILLAFLIVLLISYLDKRKVLKSFPKQAKKKL